MVALLPTYAQLDNSEPLRGFRLAYVEAETSNEADGLTDRLNQVTELRLRRMGITVLDPKGTLVTDGSALVIRPAANVFCDDDGTCAFTLGMRAYALARMVAMPKKTLVVVVWERKSIGLTGKENKRALAVDIHLNRFLHAFENDWLKENPKQQN